MSAQTRIRPPFAYYGGKTRLAPAIASLLPAHEHYVEPFAGSLAVLLAKEPSRMETVNDLDGDLVTFWRVLRDRRDELELACALTPHSRAEHVLSYDLPDNLDEIERARRVWVSLTQCRAGSRVRTGWRYYQDPAGSSSGMPRYLAGYVGRIPAAAQRLAHVSLECRPALELVSAFGRHSDVLLYVDPPYLGDVRASRGYLHEMKGQPEHRELLDALLACRSGVVLSGYAHPLYDDALSGWARHEIATFTGQGGANSARVEVLWSNRPLGGTS